MSTLFSPLIAVLAMLAVAPDAQKVRVPLNESRELDVGDLVTRLAEAAGVDVARPSAALALPTDGLAGPLTRRMLAESLGPQANLAFEPRALIVSLDPRLFTAEARPAFRQRLLDLADRAEREAQRRLHYGMHALRSYRANDRGRPTVCLVHGLNSSSGGFMHMIAPIEAAGYGVVVYDYPFNRDLDATCKQFARDWATFRREMGENRPWAIVTHSMGALVARSYVEDPGTYGGDVFSMILIAPVSQGASLARHQTVLQLLSGMRAINGKGSSDAMAQLGDGIGEAARDMLPGSAFLKALNGRPRRAGVPYHILAGDVGFVRAEARARFEGQVKTLLRDGGLLAGLARLVAADLPTQLDELCDGTGDGCMAVARTKLDGVADHVVIHANHAELIRALLFSDAGPVACMPYVGRWLKQDLPR